MGFCSCNLNSVKEMTVRVQRNEDFDMWKRRQRQKHCCFSICKGFGNQRVQRSSRRRRRIKLRSHCLVGNERVRTCTALMTTCPFEAHPRGYQLVGLKFNLNITYRVKA